MSKNLVVCCDGTNNQFGSCNTNVVRLVQVLDRDPARQLVYYDPGLGTLPEPGFWTPVGKWFSKVIGLAFGVGLEGKVARAYMFLMRHYVPGDQIYLYGFSRGAYTVRVLAGVLHQFGLLPSGNENLVPYVMRYTSAVKGLDGKSAAKRSSYWKVAREFRRSFARTITQGQRESRTVKVRFMGLWDTVSSVGWVWEPSRFPHTTKNPGVEIVRHAVALDERRAFYRQNRWTDQPKPGQDVAEWWFPGAHSDVGGGHPEGEGGLWRAPWLWVLWESRRAGLRVRTKAVRQTLKRTPIPQPGWANRPHDSLTWRWWWAEVFPKLRWHATSRRNLPHVNLGRCRHLAAGTLLHASVLRRLRRTDLNYTPANVSPAMIAQVRALKIVPRVSRMARDEGGDAGA
ncbi:T6SS phospholipase effector Tle1-like catalytic domain-containing protein [Synoicihabitans lomoniglobus]|uniref:DUF2235 domain-containing protein n=1 Tax=Synoicihabitans lomoniglobus TaxID=2909285 RepID=A0AAF0I6P5_9BACT|nr:DUF2235 domain-containing protein [Opitutaceae bacterium LMO-M01]WED66211.1 DUF2235 domain-containing protein [Opitutaceae bacterium LMO-M01]